MKIKTAPTSAPTAPSDEVIRDYAFHLYEQNGCAPGRDLDNWLEAAACLKANIPAHRAHNRLHEHAAKAASAPAATASAPTILLR